MLDINTLIKEASEKNASDIHITVGAPPRFRIQGELVQTNFPKMTPGDTLEVLLNLMTPEQRDTFERKGDIDISVSVKNSGRFRVNAYKQRGMITITMRLVDMEIPDARSLKLPDEVMKLCDERKGLILVTGPSGSGKSTVIASLIDWINSTRACNIITLENPIEYIHSSKMSIVNQREIGIDAVDYHSAISSALKQDPDVLDIGEIGDENEASLTLLAAETGRLVFSNFYTMSAVDTIGAFIDLFPEERRRRAGNRLASVLRATVSRQLIPSSEGNLIPAYEILIADNAVREMIREGKIRDIAAYMENNTDKGLITMDQYIYRLYKDGLISGEEALKSACDRESMGTVLGDSSNITS
ncbi:MAG: PilT/PilU family type 4a pilus ATPase [Lachnospiraceae bacterium]|nr:PilT/PilU family type 4a pilus ATPase [Lachnospiraceae bacterium]